MLEQVTREEFVSKMSEGPWASKGAGFRTLRLAEGISVRGIANSLGVSDSTIRRFESGKPVMAARLLANAYTLALNLHDAGKLGFKPQHTSYSVAETGATLFIEELEASIAVQVTRIGGEEVAVFDTQNYDVNRKAAIALCTAMGERFYYYDI